MIDRLLLVQLYRLPAVLRLLLRIVSIVDERFTGCMLPAAVASFPAHGHMSSYLRAWHYSLPDLLYFSLRGWTGNSFKF